MIVGCTCLTAEISIGSSTHISPQALRCATGFAHTAHEQLLHEECALVGDGLFLFGWSYIYLLAFSIHNAGDEHWLHMFAVVGNGAIGVDHFQQVDI